MEQKYTFSVGNETEDEQLFHRMKKLMPKNVPTALKSENPRYAVYQFAEFFLSSALTHPKIDRCEMQLKITVSPGETTPSETYEVEVNQMGMEFIE